MENRQRLGPVCWVNLGKKGQGMALQVDLRCVVYEGLFRWLRQPLENNTQDRNLGPLLHVQME